MRVMLVLLAALLVAVFSAPALAHQPPVVDDLSVLMAPAGTLTDAISAAPARAVDPLALGLMALGVAGLALLRRLPRRALGVAIVLCLSLLAFESGVHSVHHLGQAAQEATCVIAAGATHLHGATPVSAAADTTILAPAERLVSARPSLSASDRSRPHQGRAPPALA